MSLLPPNSTAVERTLEAVTSRLSAVPVPVKTVWNAESCPAALLPWLAWAMSVDHWNPNWTEKVKRQVIAQSWSVHKIKGTVAAVENALEALDLDDVSVEEWFNYTGGLPGYFRVDVHLQTRGLTDEETKDIEATISATKNLRSHLDRLRIWLTTHAAAPVCGCLAMCGEVTTIYPYTITEVTADPAMPIVAAAATMTEFLTVNPMGA